MHAQMPSSVPVPNFEDVKDLWLEYWWNNPLVYVGLGVVFLIVVVLVARYYWHKKYRRVGESSDQKALRLLHELLQKNKNADSTQDIKVLYALLALIMKEFYCAIFDVSLVGLTDREFLDFLRRHDEAAFVAMQSIMQRSAAIKFAAGKQSREQLDADILLCIHVVSGHKEIV